MVEQLNLNQLRVFAVVYRNKSMTLAAKELHLTQSGVSQHVKALESVLGKKLFDRIQQRIVPTSTANTLYEGCSRGMYELEQAFWKISGKELSGQVNVGVPPEFAYNVILPLVPKFYRAHQKINFRLVIGLASRMNEKLLRGEVDFAFVDDFSMDPRVKTVRVYDEVLELCLSPTLLRKFGPAKHHKEFYAKLPYVAYEPEMPVLTKWFSHHLPKKKFDLDICGYFGDCQSVLRMITAGIGAGVIPSYVYENLKKEKAPIQSIAGSARPLYNRISLALVEGRTQTLAAHTAVEFLRGELRASD